MKKYLSLCFALLCGTSLFAAVDNTFRFVDKNGTEYPDGSELNLEELEMSAFGFWQVPSGLYVENTTSSQQNIRVTLDITSISANTNIQFCVLMNCNNYENVGTYTKSGVERANYKDDLMLEWFPEYNEDEETGDMTPIPGGATATLKADLMDSDGKLKAEGPKITLNFKYSDPASVSGVEDNTKAAVVARYNADGQRVAEGTKGLNILKLSNGKTVKQIVK